MFAWAGFIIINAAFLGIISWGSATSWVVGFVFNVLYTFALLGAAIFLERRIQSQAKETAEDGTDQEAGKDSNDDDPEQEESKEETNRTLKVVSVVLYLLFVFALGTCGIILAINVFGCGGSEYRPGRRDVTWKPKDSVPQEIRDKTYNDYTSFLYFPSTGTTWFPGNLRQGNYRLFSVSQGNEPTPFVPFLESPSKFTNVSNDTACLVANYSKTLLCSSDGIDLIEPTVENNEVTIEEYLGLFTVNDTLWITSNEKKSDWREVIYLSLNMETMELEIHSERIIPDDDVSNDKDDDDNICDDSRKVAIMVLILSAIPVVAASVLVYVFRNAVPSMVLSSYIGLTGMAVTIYVIVDPEIKEIESVLKWWFAGTGLASVLVQSYLSLMNKIPPATAAWSAFTGGIPYFVGICWVLEIFTEWDNIWRWVLVNFICFIPFMGLGVALGQGFYLVLGVIGLLLDAGNAAYRIGEKFDTIIVPFLFLALFGGLVIALGIFLQGKSKAIQNAVDKWAGVRPSGTETDLNVASPSTEGK